MKNQDSHYRCGTTGEQVKIVQFAGDGKLADESECSSEFRQFLEKISSSKLFEFVDQCLSDSFPEGGFVLQDVVNELGRRLDYIVTNGRYRGRKNQIGFDGVWRSPEEWALVVEVKTTDTYRLNLDTIAEYLNKLKHEESVGERSSILIVVGRQDTGDLEAQIRGSRHAWDIRLLSAASLGTLVRLKEESGDETTTDRIRSLLMPREYTRLDELIEIVIVTAEDIRRPVEETPDEDQDSADSDESLHKRTDKNVIDLLRARLVELFAKIKQKELLKKSKAQYWSADKNLRACCSISKYYERTGHYWYAYHPAWHEFIGVGEEGFLILGCVGADVAFALPHDFMASLLEKLNTTERPDGKSYWHLHLTEIEPDKFALKLRGAGQTISIDQFKIRNK